jgi:hypothetical protein
MKTVYEWSFQHMDSNGDIIDHEFADSLAEYPALVRQLWDGGECDYANCASHEIELWRNTWEDYGDWSDLLHRSYALVEEGALPMHTDDGSIVPQRFHREFMNWHK